LSSFLDSIYSEASRKVKPSPIRDMLHVIRQPGMISFAGGMPDPEVFPIGQFKEAARIFDREGKDVLQYGTTEGYQPLKEFLCEWTAPRMGRKPIPEQLLTQRAFSWGHPPFPHFQSYYTNFPLHVSAETTVFLNGP